MNLSRSILENSAGNLIILRWYFLTHGLVNFAHAQQHSFGVQFWQEETASCFKSIQAGTLSLKKITNIFNLKITTLKFRWRF